MAGIFPTDGVPCGQAFNASCNINTVSGCDPQFYSRRCLQSVEVSQINALISEIGNLVSCLGKQYDCNSLTNMCDAIKDYVAGAGNPVGTIITFAALAPPDGYLKCNGAVVSRTTYARLYNAIGDTYGAGDGSTTFSIPDLRGEFIRGLDEGRGVDPDSNRNLWSLQGDTIRNIVGTVSMSSSGWFDTLNGPFYNIGTTNGSSTNGSLNGRTDDFGFDASRVVPTSSENRPRNRALVYCIKY